jgi:multiple sugar transport system permease protein
MKSAFAKRESRSGYLFAMPAGLLVISLVIYPLTYGIFISFFKTDLIANWKFVGLRYYHQILSNSDFFASLRISATFAFLVVLGNLSIGLLLAVILNQKIRFATAFKVILMLPWLLPEVVAALIWKWLFNPTYGLINYILQSLNIIHSNVAWLDTGRSAFAGVVFVAIWKGFPMVMILMTAGLKNIPAERYEAASIDGANRWQQFRYISLPGLMPILLITCILETAWWFKHFTIIYLLTAGGPNGATTVASIDIYNNAFRDFDWGRASAEAVVILLLLSGVSFVYSKALRDESQ